MDTIFPTHYTPINRPKIVSDERSNLPILEEEDALLDSFILNEVTIVVGETGSGKSTQIPQILYESGFCRVYNGHDLLIGMTQPRKIAAINISNRLLYEMGKQNTNFVSHITSESSTYRDGESFLKIMTEGVLLKELEADLLLSQYSAVILDEAHERSVYMDIILGFMSRIVLLRKKSYAKDTNSLPPLRLILMSATADINTLLSIFPTELNRKIIQIKGRSYPVTWHFLKNTPIDYVNAAAKLVKKIHKFLPKGDILVFLPGKMDIENLCHILKKWCNSSNDGRRDDINNKSNLKIFPLHSSILISIQKEILSKTDENTSSNNRKCIVSTNIAETSLTIPNICYVVDSGLIKLAVYDFNLLSTQHIISWTSKSSICQRAGRAGRVTPGHYYTLFSSSVYENDFKDFLSPEILRQPIEWIVLTLKCMGIEIVYNFPFPSPPSKLQIVNAEKILIILGALKAQQDKTKITDLGRSIQKFPLHPSQSKALHLAVSFFKSFPNKFTPCLIELTLHAISLITNMRLLNGLEFKTRSSKYGSELFWLMNYIESSELFSEKSDLIKVIENKTKQKN